MTLGSSIIKDGGSITNMADYDLIFDEIYGYIATFEILICASSAVFVYVDDKQTR